MRLNRRLPGYIADEHMLKRLSLTLDILPGLVAQLSPLSGSDLHAIESESVIKILLWGRNRKVSVVCLHVRLADLVPNLAPGCKLI
jgi:hypothetical protein